VKARCPRPFVRRQNRLPSLFSRSNLREVNPPDVNFIRGEHDRRLELKPSVADIQ